MFYEIKLFTCRGDKVYGRMNVSM